MTNMRISIIGAGPGGYEAAIYAARKGFDVNLIAGGPLGGTCLNEGCIPTKALCRNAEVLDTLRDAETFGVRDLHYDWDFGAVLQRKEAIISQLRDGIAFLLKNPRIQLLEGRAELLDAHHLRVRLHDGGESLLKTDYILIATGSESAMLPIPGAERCISSREILSLPAVPQRLCVIGGGVIGLEFASIFRSFGSEVTVLEYCKNILPRFDEDLSKRLKQSLSKRGISIVTSAEVRSVEEGFTVRYLLKGKEETVQADQVLMAVGRRPALESLELDALGIQYSRRGISVNNYMQTSVPNVYAAGDITGGMMLAHAATFQGYRAINHILAGQPATGDVDAIRLDVVPAAVFTTPEAAMVGMTEADCEKAGIKPRSLKSFFRANGKALAMGAPDGFCKILVSEEGEILGCHLFGAHAADLIQEMTVLIGRHASLEEFRSVIHAHPTLGEVLQQAAHA